MANLPRHFVRFGSHNEQEFVSGSLRDTYEGLAFNANLVAWSATGIAGFLCGSGLWRKPYFIDPLTHGFQHNISALTNDDGEIKQSIIKLINAYGEPVSTALVEEERPLRKEDLEGDVIRNEFVENVLEFQKTTLHEEAREHETWKYLKYAYSGEGELDLRPAVLVCPYFYVTEETTGYWLDLNIDLAERGLERIEGEGAVQIVIGRDVLTNTERRKEIANRYQEELDPAYFFVWVDGFPEYDVGYSELQSFRDFCSTLGGSGADVLNMYGGYLSTLLSHPEVGVLSGVCHGPQYGEDRSVEPVGGGLPTARFYMRPLHHRLRFPEALAVLRSEDRLASAEDYWRYVCNCPTCERLIEEHGPSKGFAQFGKTEPLVYQRQGSTVTTEYAVREALVNAAEHYMYAKHWEFSLIEERPPKYFAEALERNAEKFNERMGQGDASYLNRWSGVLGDYVRDE